MHRRRLVQGLTITFGATSLVLAIVGILTNPVLLVLAAVFLVVTGLLWYQASGRLAERVYRRVEAQARVDGDRRTTGAGDAGFGAGPRAEWTGPRRREGRKSGGGGARGRRRQRTRTRQQSRTATDSRGISARDAYDVLGLDPDADQAAIKAAYRDRIKEVHPDTDGGDQEAFQRVRTAYERLSD